MRRELLDVVRLEHGERILDMCCGTGSATFAIAQRAGERSRIIGIDLSSGQIRVAKKRNKYPNVEFIVNDASHTSFDECEFDRIVIPHAIHEMRRPTRLSVLAEALRVLKPGGALAVLEMDNPPSVLWRLLIGFWWFYWLPFNFETPTRRDMLRHGVVEEVGEAGFRDAVKSSLFNGVLQVVQATK